MLSAPPAATNSSEAWASAWKSLGRSSTRKPASAKVRRVWDSNNERHILLHSCTQSDP